MGVQVVPIPLVIFFLVICCNGIEGRMVSDSSTETTILTDYGNTYDCVDFYKQPAFDHPLLKNRTFDYKVLTTPVPASTFNDSINDNNYESFELEGEACPMGTVPISRGPKIDLAREKVANGGGVYVAGARTNTMNRYTGASAAISLHMPEVTNDQYSAARIKLKNGDDSMEVGWRVDPKLYGNTEPRFYVHTMAGKKSCFNAHCGGFILLSNRKLFDTPIRRTSDARKYIEIRFYIIRDVEGHWNLFAGLKHVKVGFWPSKLFTGLKDVASYIEWGGEVYDQNPIPTAEMGAGKIDKDDRRFKNACFRQTSEYNGNALPVDATDLEAFSDNEVYSSDYRVFKHEQIRGEVIYGGPN